MCLLLLLAAKVSAQDFSNKGKEFWVGYGFHQNMTNGNPQDMVLYFTSDVNANVTVEIPRLGYLKTYTVSANTVTETTPIPKTGAQDARLRTEGLYNSGIHITSDRPVVAYAHIYYQNASGATLLFPVNTLGQDYYSLNYTQKSNADSSSSWAYVVATEDSTLVEITPSANTFTHNAGVPFTVTLDKGQIYNLMGKLTTFQSPYLGNDLTGTRIRSVSSGSSGCKRIAVFSGSGRVAINCTAGVSSSDNFITQIFPSSAWGKSYLTVPTKNLSNNYFRIAVSDPTTVVKVNGVQATGLVNNFYYQINANTPQSITADKPILVAQYITSTNSNNGPTCGNANNDNGDPEIILLSPIEQTIDKITLNSTPHYNITTHYINVIIKTAAISSFKLDGTARTASFVAHPQDPSYSYAVFTVNQGTHSLIADSGFNAIAYGYGQFESYGYNAGTNIKDLYQFITLQNQYATVTAPATCSGTPFLFSMTLPYLPTILTWDFGNNPNQSPNTTVTINNPTADSSYVRDGRTLYVFKLPGNYMFTAVGTYPIRILADNPTGGGCSGQQEIDYDLEVTPRPKVNFTVSHSGCISDAATFTDVSNGNGNTLLAWSWEFGDGTTDTARNPVKLYGNVGTYNVHETVVNQLGCFGDTIKPFIIAPQATAHFNLISPACAGLNTVFKDSSIISTGSIVKWFWTFGDGDSLTASTNTPVNHMYAATGTYVVTLVVQNNSGCKSAPFKDTITVYAAPVVDFSVPNVCLPQGTASFTNLTTIADGTTASITYAWNFGDGGTSTSTNPTHNYPTGGPFNVQLTATSIHGCVKDSIKAVTNIYAQPHANFTYVPAGICEVDSAHFSDVSTAAGSTVTAWFWDFGDGTTSNVKNPVKHFPDSGNFVVTLHITSAAACGSDTITKVVHVNKKPTAAFTINGSTCVNQAFTTTDHSTANSGTLVKWYWNFDDGTSAIKTNGNPFADSFSTSGTYIIKLVVESDKGCKSDTARQTIVVNPAPVVNFSLPVVCPSDVAVFNDSSYLAGNPSAALTYLWNFGDGGTSTAVTGQHQYAVEGQYTVMLTASSGGCATVKTKTFTVNGASPVAAFKVLDSANICSNDAVQIQDSSYVATGTLSKIEVLWDAINNPGVVVTDNAPAIGKVYTHNYPAQPVSTTYQIKVRAFSGQSCVDEKTISVTVKASPNVVFGAVAPFCQTDNPRMITEATETTGIACCGSFVGDGISSSGMFNPQIAGVGQHPITYVFTSGAGCTDSATQAITVVANPTVTLPQQLFVLEGGFAVIEPVTTGSISTYLWSPTQYMSNAHSSSPTITPAANITYQVIVSTAEGCSDTAKMNVVVLQAPIIPTAFSPNGDGINDVWNIQSLSTYPDCTVEVFSRYGDKVFESFGYKRPWDGTRSGKALPVGTYYYIINPKNGRPLYSGNVTILR